MGSSNRGRLGLPNETLPEIMYKPTQVTYGLPEPSFNSKIIEVVTGHAHTLAITRQGDIYSWGEGSSGRLGLGYLNDSKNTPNQVVPHKIPNVFDNKNIVSASAGKILNGLVMQSGTVYSWGKGEHEKSKKDEHKEFSTPYTILEQKQIMHLSFGTSHALLMDRMSCVYAWGEGSKGCLGFGDGKKRFSPTPLSFFDNKRVIDVSCGELFSVIIAEVEGDPEERGEIMFDKQGLVKRYTRAQSKLTMDFNKILEDDSILRSNRTPLCGGQDISIEVMEKVKRVIAKNA
jgi:alpha-tubulin suppressor-like RCC1 family protein